MTGPLRIGIGAVVVAALLLACGATEPEARQVEWVQLTLESGGTLDIAVLRPESAAKGVVVAFPWGAGDAGLLLGLMQSYWDPAAPDAGYAVVGVVAYGPGLERNGGEVMAAVMGWIDENLGEAGDKVVMTGASAGGVGVFHAALAVPDRVGGIIAMPGRYSGEASLEVLADAAVWMMVGEGDTNWVGRSEATAGKLEAAGVEVTHEVVRGQGHVLRVDQDVLVRWIEGR
ncbi:MAG: hypothetical protein F4X60_16080 [Gemmatimonadetes bacterium]|nr:hypothetical protein [Gemmatimonadota bacterium]